MAGKGIAQRRRRALVKKDFHERGRSDSGQAVLCAAQHSCHLLTSYPWKPFKEVLNARTILNVLKEGANRYACSFEHPRAAHLVGSSFDGIAPAPINHQQKSAIFSAGGQGGNSFRTGNDRKRTRGQSTSLQVLRKRVQLR